MLQYSTTKYYLGVIIPLLLATCICLLYRSPNTFGNLIFEDVFHVNIHQNNTVNYIFIYNLPAALWVFSTTLLSLDFKIKIFNKKSISLIYLPILFVIGLECLQYFNITDGTFDILDILIPLLLWLMAFTLLKVNKISQKNFNKNFQFSLFQIAFVMVIFADTY